MFKLWFWMYMLSKVVGILCPYTLGFIGQIVGTLTMIARYVFIVLVFIFAPEWWWGMVLLAFEFLLTVITPRVDASNMSSNMMMLSEMFSSIVAPACMFFAYLAFFSM